MGRDAVLVAYQLTFIPSLPAICSTWCYVMSKKTKNKREENKETEEKKRKKKKKTTQPAKHHHHHHHHLRKRRHRQRYEGGKGRTHQHNNDTTFHVFTTSSHPILLPLLKQASEQASRLSICNNQHRNFDRLNTALSCMRSELFG
jgi:hypothetical protein